MDKSKEKITDFYKSNQYQLNNPTLHEEDSFWKSKKILLSVDYLLRRHGGKMITILDVGGGAGLILSTIAIYIKKIYKVDVVKYAIDLSPGMLSVQKENNPDLKICLNEDIKETSLRNKSVDLVLMIDVLEHLSNPSDALEEINRISKYCIFKVPLEDNLDFRLINFFNGGKLKKMLEDKVGHINSYNSRSLKTLIEQSGFKIINFEYTNVFEYLKKSEYYKGKIHGWEKIANYIGSIVYRISPKLAGYLLPDYAIILAESV
jgi:SAM-dependent methyltransferase